MTGTAEPGTWTLCPNCDEMLYGRHLVRNSNVCPDCDWHGPLPAWDRIELLLDEGSADPLTDAGTDTETAGADLDAPDPLHFSDVRPYPDRLRAARKQTGLQEAVVCVRGTIGGEPVVAAVMDFRFLGGSLGAGVGARITHAAEVALRTRTPLLIVAASGGARMQEGTISLMQMAKTAQALAQLDEAGILTVSLVTDPTFGGVAASYATLCDIIVAEPGARLGFAGPRVIEQTIREALPEGFQTAEFLVDRGMVDLIRHRSELPVALAQLLRARAGRAAPPAWTAPPAPASRDDADVVVRDPAALAPREAWSVVRQARDLDRPTMLDYVAGVFDAFVELAGDRVSGDCPAIVGGIGWLDGLAVVAVGHQKGHTAAELKQRNFGMATPAGYRKAARLMRLADKLGLPIVTFVDTPGAYPGVEAEENGQAFVIAENLRLMSRLSVPVVSVILGEGGSGGALAIAVANQVLMCENAVYSVISPEGCAAILWKDVGAAATAAATLRITAVDLLRLGVVDGVIPEPDGGNRHGDPEVPDRMRRALAAALGELLALDAGQVQAQRHERFRAFGSPDELTMSHQAGAAP